jgi:hypothetical protein
VSVKYKQTKTVLDGHVLMHVRTSCRVCWCQHPKVLHNSELLCNGRALCHDADVANYTGYCDATAGCMCRHEDGGLTSLFANDGGAVDVHD